MSTVPIFRNAHRGRTGTPRRQSGVRRPWAAAIAVASAGLVLPLVAPASPAQASPANNVCVFEQSPISWQQTFFVPGNGHAMFASAQGYVAGDLLRFRATGDTQIATWGDHKAPNGDTTVAPDDGRWPAPGIRQYALLMRIRSGNVQFISGGAIPDARVLGDVMTPWRWYAAGTDSGCLRIVDPPPAVEFLVNDANIGDNNDGPTVTLKQWW
jgi:hypothetical protein